MERDFRPCALSGNLAPETLRLLGLASGHHVVVLVDGGSTHNFIQEELVQSIGLPTQTTTPLRVLVGNGQHLACSSWCPRVTLTIQDLTCDVDL